MVGFWRRYIFLHFFTSFNRFSPLSCSFCRASHHPCDYRSFLLPSRLVDHFYSVSHRREPPRCFLPSTSPSVPLLSSRPFPFFVSLGSSHDSTFLANSFSQAYFFFIFWFVQDNLAKRPTIFDENVGKAMKAKTATTSAGLAGGVKRHVLGEIGAQKVPFVSIFSFPFFFFF